MESGGVDRPMSGRTVVACLAILALATLAGCVRPSNPSPEESASSSALTMQGAAAPVGVALEWQGAWLVYSPTDELRCGPANCEVRMFNLAPVPGGNWTLQVALDWADSHDANTGDWDPYYPSFNMTLRAPDGSSTFRPGVKFGNAVQIENPTPGDYELEVRITHMIRDWDLPFFLGRPVPIDPVLAPTSGTYRGTVLLAQREAANPGPLLPDLLLRDLDGLRIEYSAPGQGHGFVPDAWLPTTKGCTAGENQESAATRCLRFSVAIGNDGPGPFALTTVLSDDPAVAARQQAGLESETAIQCVADGQGSGTVREAGTATFSPSHSHLHYDDILGYALFTYDIGSATRGLQVATGAKLGYGPAPEALVRDGHVLAGGAWDDDPCGLSGHVGLNAGWYDYYLWWRTGQFIDIAGVPDGVYEVVATINPVGNILESGSANNAGSVVFRLTGDAVEVLRPFVFVVR